MQGLTGIGTKNHYKLRPCKVCDENIPAVTKSGLRYKKKVYETLNCCQSARCRTTWKKKSSNTRVFNPPMDIIDYWCLGMMDEYRRLINQAEAYKLQYGKVM